MNSKIKYLLLDLDGTLIHFDINIFIREYLRLIQKQFSHYSYAKFVPEWIMKGTEMMLSNEGTVTNKERFLGYFCSRTGMSESEIWEIFLHFYKNDYEQILSILGAMNNECLMIGNDREMDLASEKIGIPAFFLTPNVLSSSYPRQHQLSGNYDVLLEYLNLD